MRISYWSADVCSYDRDLGADLATPPDSQYGFGPHEIALRIVPSQIARQEDEIDAMNTALDALRSFILPGGTEAAARLHLARAVTRRAEEHTSELQSLMRISYAVFCLDKNNIN